MWVKHLNDNNFWMKLFIKISYTSSLELPTQSLKQIQNKILDTGSQKKLPDIFLEIGLILIWLIQVSYEIVKHIVLKN